jgi:hypothetical protein
MVPSAAAYHLAMAAQIHLPAAVLAAQVPKGSRISDAKVSGKVPASCPRRAGA